MKRTVSVTFDRGRQDPWTFYTFPSPFSRASLSSVQSIIHSIQLHSCTGSSLFSSTYSRLRSTSARYFLLFSLALTLGLGRLWEEVYASDAGVVMHLDEVNYGVRWDKCKMGLR